MTWKPHTTVAAIIERDKQFLLVEERPDGQQHVFNQPAGHLEAGESLTDAVIRETREETAWGFKPQGLVGIYRWQVPPAGQTYIRFCFFGTCDDHQPEQPLDSDIIRAVWMSRAQLEENTQRLRSPLVLRCIDHYLAGCRYPLELINDLAAH